MTASVSGSQAAKAGLGDVVRSYILKETVFSIVANSLISLGFALAVAHGLSQVPVWHGVGVALDFVPQTFMLVFMTTLVVTAVARMNMRKGRVPPIAAPVKTIVHRAPANVLARSLVFGLATTLIFVPFLLAVLLLIGADSLGYGTFLGMKVFYGAVLSVLITPLILRAALTLDSVQPATRGRAAS